MDVYDIIVISLNVMANEHNASLCKQTSYVSS